MSQKSKLALADAKAFVITEEQIKNLRKNPGSISKIFHTLAFMITAYDLEVIS